MVPWREKRILICTDWKKNVSSVEWKDWKRLYSLVWWLPLYSLVSWGFSTLPVPFASVVLKGRRRSSSRNMGKDGWHLTSLLDIFCEWVCCNKLWFRNCVNSYRFPSYKLCKCLQTLVPSQTIFENVWTPSLMGPKVHLSLCARLPSLWTGVRLRLSEAKVVMIHCRYVHNWRAKLISLPLQSLAPAKFGTGVVDIAFSTYVPSSTTTCPPKQPRNSSDSCPPTSKGRLALPSS